MEEKTSHFVQLDDGTYAEMVEGHEMVAPGHQMLVEDQDGQKLVVVNPAPGDEPQTIVVPEQAETVYVIGEEHPNPGLSSVLTILHFSLTERVRRSRGRESG